MTGAPTDPRARDRADSRQRPAALPQGAPTHGDALQGGASPLQRHDAATVQSQPAEPLLQLVSIGKTYRAHKRAHAAVERLDLSLRTGESIALVGESGAGKTTTARIAALLERPTTGRVLWRGVDVTGAQGRKLKILRSQLQYIGQDPARTFDQRWSVGRTLAEPLANFGICPKRAVRPQVERLLEQVHLPLAFADRLPRELSGGQLQRVAIARALAVRPQVIVCDEITSALDATVQESVLELLEQIRTQTHVALLFVHHDLVVAQRMSDRMLVMKEGRIVASFNASELTRVGNAYVEELVASMFTLDGIRDF